MTGRLASPVVVVFLTGQPNAMGQEKPAACGLPGYRHVQNPQDRDVVGSLETEARPNIINWGRTAWDIITGLENGEVGCLWMATNPVVTGLGRTKAACGDPTVYQDAYYPTKQLLTLTSCPAAQWGENWNDDQLERVTRSVLLLPPAGEAKQIGRYSPQRAWVGL